MPVVGILGGDDCQTWNKDWVWRQGHVDGSFARDWSAEWSGVSPITTLSCIPPPLPLHKKQQQQKTILLTRHARWGTYTLTTMKCEPRLPPLPNWPFSKGAGLLWCNNENTSSELRIYNVGFWQFCCGNCTGWTHLFELCVASERLRSLPAERLTRACHNATCLTATKH